MPKNNRANQNIGTYLTRMQKNNQNKSAEKNSMYKSMAQAKNVADAKNMADAKNVADEKTMADGKIMAEAKTMADGKTIFKDLVTVCHSFCLFFIFITYIQSDL
jgi:hypothetical protein